MSGQKPSIPSLTSLAAFSHEFRTPLNGVLGMAQLLESTRLTAEQRAYVAVLRESGDHLLTLVNDLLDLAKLESGQLELSPAPMDPADLLRSVCELLSPRAHAKGLEVAWAAPAGIPHVLADESRLRQVMLNLAGNAIKFTDAGGAFLTVRQTAAKAGRVILRFSVEDTGPGVALADQDRIFEAFAQGRDHAHRADSTGLGLTVVSRLAESHDGRVGVDSTPGKGAIFWFEARFDLAAKPQSAPSLVGQTVVIATQNSVLARAAKAQVEAYGGQALVCPGLAEAEFAGGEDAVVLVDYALGRGEGLEPLTNAPCLILVAPEERVAIGDHRAAGFEGYLIKPLRAASLAARVLTVKGKAPPAAAKDERAQAETAPGARVLLVEDHPVNALLARKLLEREGCSVDWVTTGEMALTAANAGHDLILMDRRLPGLDGPETARRLRAAGVACPIVALTADAFDDDRRLCLGAGMDDFIVKPLEPMALRAVLSRLVARRWTKPKGNAKLAS
ncbi:MAG TPA: response regulator [Caulobacteraceae bacterium]|nr:response regulator [Caulobacteraceae bacterium]